MSGSLRALNVLLVEDNNHMRSVARSILRAFGISNLRECSDGAEALDVFQLGATDLIITDLHMTMLDGVELTKMIRSAPDSAGRFTPIILMTAFAEKSRILEARDAGVTEICAKPFTPIDLHRKIVNCINHPRRFVRSNTFIGPDRRRLKGLECEVERRAIQEDAA